jgi:tetratricopeptide (TPR) repeat protein
LVFIKKGDIARALADLDRSIAAGKRVANYSVRAQAYEEQGRIDLAIADLREATELKGTCLFDLAAQAEAKKRLERLSRRNSCRGAGATRNDTCL